MSQVPIQGDVDNTQFSKRYEVEIEDPTAVALLVEAANPLVVFKLKLTKPAGYLDAQIQQLQFIMQGDLLRTAGAGSITMAWQESVDDITYVDELSSSKAAGPYERQIREVGDQLLNDTTLFLRVCFFNSDATTAGEFRRFKMFADLLIPQGYTVERLV